MESILIFIKALAVGYLVSIPLGPVGIVCARLVLEGGLRAGIIAGFGAATADTLYALLASLGLTFVLGFLYAYQGLLTAISAFLLIAMGLRLIMTRPHDPASAEPFVLTTPVILVSMFLLTISNVTTFFIFIALFAKLGLNPTTPGGVLALVSGIFAGSISWWTTLSNIVMYIKGTWMLRHRRAINACIGALIVLCGVYLLLSYALHT
jgi:threonine/homoserine/homoserine lactone efflux protein